MTDFDTKNEEMAKARTAETTPSPNVIFPQTGHGDSASLHKSWQRISHALKADLGAAKWKAWIKPLVFESFDDGRLILQAESSFIRNRVLSNYGEKIRILAKGEFADLRAVEIVCDRTAPIRQNGSNEQNEQISPSSGALPPRITTKPDPGRELNGNVEGLDSRFTFENFVVGTPNQLAYAISKRVSESIEATYNPLFLYGGVGLGKTHLMHAIAWEIHHRQPDRKVMYLSAEKFMYRFIRALRYRDMMSFKEQFRSVDVLMIDDVQFISGKDSTQEEFFHTFNALVEDGRQVVLSADKSPTDLSGLEERLRSRLGWGMVADIHPADYELRLGILQARRAKSGVEVPDKVLEFLARKITSNIREIEGAFNRIVAQVTFVGKPITVETARELLADLLRANRRRVTIDEIQKQVARHFNIRVADMFSARRSREIARPRQIAMYLAKNLTSLSYPEIGRHFGNRDHTTIMHAVRRVEELMLSETELADDVSLLKSILSDQ